MRLRGTAIVRGIVDADGRVQALEALKTLPPTATMDLIERGLREARYRPAELDGRLVPIGVVWTIEVDSDHQRVTVGEPGWPAQ
jgi:predicted NBD/HSP70 family sugar kinase